MTGGSALNSKPIADRILSLWTSSTSLDSMLELEHLDHHYAHPDCWASEFYTLGSVLSRAMTTPDFLDSRSTSRWLSNVERSVHSGSTAFSA